MGILAGLLLAFPLMWLILMSIKQFESNKLQEAHFLPMLPESERRSSLTYWRICESAKDCDAELVCFKKGFSRFGICTDSQCIRDTDCPAGLACLPGKPVDSERLVRTCRLIGRRKEGEICHPLAEGVEEACEAGLLCQWRCGRPCQVNDASSCPEGLFCRVGTERLASCVPSCTARSCPAGQQCIPRKDTEQGESLCGHLEGLDCRQDPCPQGQKCTVFEVPQRPWELRTACVQYCLSGSPCPLGDVCVDYKCRKSCEPEGPASCGPGFACGQNSPKDPWSCIPG